MRKNLILPKNGVVLNLKQGERLYFLAGPIRGGGDWQANAIKMLTDKDPNCYIACPCKYDRLKHEEIFKHSLPPIYDELVSEDECEIPTRTLMFESQTLWERYYLEQASYHGCIIFWLPCEDKENPRKKEDGPYARDTYGELGRWILKSSNPYQFSLESQLPRVSVTIGAEENFPGLDVIRKNLEADSIGTPVFPGRIIPSLEGTILKAIRVAKTFNPSPMNFND